ncbi:MAG TPA: GNAT family N-acetyltransferase [Phototrophicaceae bacterium]|nr:GNAT family N-acetyltransferase [Phototrophicaceae bacterium]
MTDISYRRMQPGEEQAVYDMVERCFNTFITPDYVTEGVHAFLYYAHPAHMAERQQADHFVLVADCKGVIAGMIEMRDYDHVALLFVDEAFQRRGLSRELLRQALDICRQHRPDGREITVNSSPYAVPVYERLGFRATAPEQEKSGIRFTPMVLEFRP